MTALSEAAKAMGRKGGSSTSERKKAASRLNGMKHKGKKTKDQKKND